MGIVNNNPYLRETRDFPGEDELSVELNKSYSDTAIAVNNRMIGIFPTNKGAITGEKWYINGTKPQQTIRRVYTFTSTSSLTHGINITQISQFTRMFGTYQAMSDSNWYNFVPGYSTAISGQIGFYITPTQIVFTSGAGAPTLSSGTIVLEWLSFV